MDAFNIFFHLFAYVGKKLEERSRSQIPALDDEQTAYCKTIFTSLIASCKQSSQIGRNPATKKKYHVITFKKPTELDLSKKIEDCERTIKHILDICHDDLNPELSPEGTCQKLVESIAEEWKNGKLDYAQFQDQHALWETGWRDIKDRVRGIRTNYSDPSSKPVENWKTTWISRIRDLKKYLKEHTEACEQIKSKKMKVIVTKVKEESVIERLYQLKRQLIDVGFNQGTVNIKFFREHLFDHNQPDKIFPNIKEFKDLGIDKHTIAFFVVGAKEVIQQKIYEYGIISHPRKLGIEPLPEFDESKSEKKFIIERALHDLNQKLEASIAKTFDVSRSQIIKIPPRA